MITKSARTRGRPRRFDPEAAVATAQGLFHAKGYDAVGVADITGALGINPPSFYSAFGSKAGLYARVLERYNGADTIPLRKLLRRDVGVAEGLAAGLEEAARFYADPVAPGCLVLEGIRCLDRDAREVAQAYNLAARDLIRAYIAERHPAAAEELTDFVCTTMAGLSAMARGGWSLDRLVTTARLAGMTVRGTLAE